jgi:hypothetical protein
LLFRFELVFSCCGKEDDDGVGVRFFHLEAAVVVVVVEGGRPTLRFFGTGCCSDFVVIGSSSSSFFTSFSGDGSPFLRLTVKQFGLSSL